MKPMLASDWDEAKVKFPVIAQPKIDGVRALHTEGRLTGRSLKQFGNKHVNEVFSWPALAGLDGEMTLASLQPTDPSLCRLTTSALGKYEEQPLMKWWLFDYLVPGTMDERYSSRLASLRDRMDDLRANYGNHVDSYLEVMPSVYCPDMRTLLQWDDTWLNAGYEGTIIRNPDGKHKQGRSTVREGGLLRIKRFVDFEFTIDTIIEGDTNLNEATINELGHTERSTHRANMLPNGMVGALQGVVINSDQDIPGVAAGDRVRVGAGRLSHDERKFYFENQNEILGKIGKAKFFPKGIKDKPRFPTFQSLRMEVDL